MEPFELATLFYQIVDTAHSAMANYLTVVLAVVAVSYFVAGRLDRTASGLLLAVYSFFCFGMIREIFFLYRDMAQIGYEMALSGGDALRWLGMAQSATEGPPLVIPYSVLVMCLLAYLGSMTFFYRARLGARNATETS